MIFFDSLAFMASRRMPPVDINSTGMTLDLEDGDSHPDSALPSTGIWPAMSEGRAASPSY
jgi:hypothetical protein